MSQQDQNASGCRSRKKKPRDVPGDRLIGADPVSIDFLVNTFTASESSCPFNWKQNEYIAKK